jgi:hypothetical protein
MEGVTHGIDIVIWLRTIRAYGVVGLSRSLSMREVSGSIPDMSILFYFFCGHPPLSRNRTTHYAAAAREGTSV